MSRQADWQKRKLSEGLCTICGKDAAVGTYCKRCGRIKKEKGREKSKCKPWTSGGRGRPPIY